MFKEKQNRSLKVGDFILHNSVYGVILSENSYLNEYFHERKFNNSETILCYLIEHPNEYEQKVKESITEHFNELFASNLMKKSKSLKNKFVYSVGDILCDKFGDYHIYLGRVRLKTINSYAYDLSGHGYMNIPLRLIQDGISKSDILSFLLSMFNKNRFYIYSSDIPFNDNTYTYLNNCIKVTKSKSNRFESVLSNIDVSSLNNVSFKYLDESFGIITYDFNLSLLDI